jgi:hypothetical protein
VNDQIKENNRLHNELSRLRGGPAGPLMSERAEANH